MKEKKLNLIIFICSAICFTIGLIFSILFIVISNKKITLNKEYSYKNGEFGDMIYVEFDIKFSKKTYDADFYYLTETLNAKDEQYKISNGILYTKNEESGWSKIGKVSSTKLEINYNYIDSSIAEEMVKSLGTDTIVLTCKSAKTLKTASIVLTIAGFSASLIVLLIKYMIDDAKYRKITDLLYESYQNSLTSSQIDNLPTTNPSNESVNPCTITSEVSQDKAKEPSLLNILNSNSNEITNKD